jgi:hypothetical protein
LRRNASDPDHKPRANVAEDFLLNDIWPRHRFTAGLYKIHYDLAVARPQHPRRGFDDAGKRGRIANRPDA